MLAEVVARRRSPIAKRTLAALLAGSPPHSARALTRETDAFANPIGQILGEAIDGLLDQVAAKASGEPFPALERLLRLRALQGAPPSEALGFILRFGRIVREEIEAEGPGAADRAALEARLDDLTLAAFDLFVAAREKLYAIRVDEERRRTAKLFDRLRQRSALLEEDHVP